MRFLFALVFLFGTPAFADSVPAWLARDIQRKAAWLPREIRVQGLSATFEKRWATLPDDVKAIFISMKIPEWQMALLPESITDAMLNQFRAIAEPAGGPAVSPIANRAEQLLLFAGAAELPTPGDETSGRTLGSEGCTAAISKYILAQLKLEFPRELAAMPESLTHMQSSAVMKPVLLKAARGGDAWLSIRVRTFSELTSDDVRPGSVMIAEKPGGTHVLAWTRVPSVWGWSSGDKIAVANTGLAQFGNRMILAQEFLTDRLGDPNEMSHNTHGPINHPSVYRRGGQVDYQNPGTNVYAVRGSSFILIDFL